MLISRNLISPYHQLVLDEDSRQLVTINAHRGLLHYKRLVFGPKSTPAIFQGTIVRCLPAILGVIVYLDDILTMALSPQEYDTTDYIRFCRDSRIGDSVLIRKCANSTCHL
ncbi:Uncharacterized protein K02A2.6 [Eufriesea mexicana]|uniref:Uncharacterized protein K02A2.6 n=1 Tax=Eufriesea mexicana TaxID=516756 RepID=A0A310SBY6_9HYME|nr:Uncharacterized protein K02A2.6 [Eufriesea mexicana]